VFRKQTNNKRISPAGFFVVTASVVFSRSFYYLPSKYWQYCNNDLNAFTSNFIVNRQICSGGGLTRETKMKLKLLPKS
jgi:hypothetical protein